MPRMRERVPRVHAAATASVSIAQHIQSLGIGEANAKMELRDLLDDNTLQFLGEDQEADLDTLFLAAYAQDVYAHVAPNPLPLAVPRPLTTGTSPTPLLQLYKHLDLLLQLVMKTLNRDEKV